jgi:hypothetical protein
MAMFSGSVESLLLVLCGVFSLVLGLTHIVYPQLFHYRKLIFTQSNLGQKIEPFRLWPIVYPLNLNNLYGIIWMMNFHVSFILISIGVVETFRAGWVLTQARYLIPWIAGWWLLRAGCQVLLGRRWYDWVILAGFATIGAIHLGIAWA